MSEDQFEVDGIMTRRYKILPASCQWFDEKSRSFELWQHSEDDKDTFWRVKRWSKSAVVSVHYKKNNPDTWSVF